LGLGGSGHRLHRFACTTLSFCILDFLQLQRANDKLNAGMEINPSEATEGPTDTLRNVDTNGFYVTGQRTRMSIQELGAEKELPSEITETSFLNFREAQSEHTHTQQVVRQNPLGSATTATSDIEVDNHLESSSRRFVQHHTSKKRQMSSGDDLVVTGLPTRAFDASGGGPTVKYKAPLYVKENANLHGLAFFCSVHF
jgi:hypothetical protein